LSPNKVLRDESTETDKAKAAPKQPLTAEALDAGLDAYKAQAMES
jgi:hypothetical protein